MPSVTADLHPRAIPAEQVHIYVDGQLVERCALADKQARMAAHGYTPAKPRTHRDEQRERGQVNGYGHTRSGRR